MAKEDFCFTYYDGDATRDMAHMNRLERGAYNDVVIQQRQRGHLTKDDLKKFLSKDFEIVWPSLEWVLKVDEDGKFFIEWLDKSIKTARAHSKKQSENIKNRYQTATKPLPNEILEQPLKDGDGNGIKDELKGGTGEKFLIPEMQKVFKKHIPSYGPNKERDYEPLLSIANYICEQTGTGPPVQNVAKVMEEWNLVCVHLSDPQNFYHSKSLKTISTHIQEIFQKKVNGKPTISKADAKFNALVDYTKRSG